MGSLATGQGEPFKEICSFFSPLSTSQHGVLGLWSKPPQLSSPPKPGGGGVALSSATARKAVSIRLLPRTDWRSRWSDRGEGPLRRTSWWLEAAVPPKAFAEPLSS